MADEISIRVKISKDQSARSEIPTEEQLRELLEVPISITLLNYGDVLSSEEREALQEIASCTGTPADEVSVRFQSFDQRNFGLEAAVAAFLLAGATPFGVRLGKAVGEESAAFVNLFGKLIRQAIQERFNVRVEMADDGPGIGG